MEKIICKVWKNKSNGQKLITIPKRSRIDEGDYVQVENIQQINKNSLRMSKNKPEVLSKDDLQED